MKNNILYPKHLILIDKYNKDYSELETELKNYNKSGLAKPKTIFVIYKQDMGKELKNIDVIRIDLVENYIEHNYYVLLSTKEVKSKTFHYKFEIIDFVKKHF